MLYKRDGSPNWYVKLEKDGQVIRESTGTTDRRFAKAFELKRSKELYEAKALGIERRTLREAVERWTREKAGKRSLDRDMQILSRIPQQDAILAEFAPRAMQDYLQSLAASTSPANANRHRACIVSLLNKAAEWGWLDRAPKLAALRYAKHEPRWLGRDEFDRLLVHLPEHVASMARFAAATGLRYSNVAGFRWDWVRDGVGYVPPGSAKAGRAIPVPLNAAALKVLAECQGKHPEFVFTDHRGHAPIGSVKTAWLKAVHRAGLDGVRFHDLRHAWASWHLQAGTPMHVLQRLGGWQSYDMITKCYGHFSTEELSKYAQRVE